MQDAVAVDVFGRVEAEHGTIGSARCDDRDLAFEGDEAFEDERHRAKLRIGAVRIVGRRAEHLLALAVIAQAPGLQYALAAEILQCLLEIGLAVDGVETGCRNVATVDEALFDQPVLSSFQRLRGRVDRHALCQRFGSGDGHVLEFVGDDVAEPRQFGER